MNEQDVSLQNNAGVGRQIDADRNAKLSMYLGVASLFVACLAGIPAVILGLKSMKRATSKAKLHAYVGVGLGGITSLFGLAYVLLLVALVGMRPARGHAGSSAGVPSAEEQSSTASLEPSASSALEPSKNGDELVPPQSPIDLVASKATPGRDFDPSVAAWALYPPGTTECGTDFDGKVERLDRPGTSDEFEARRLVKQRDELRKKYLGTLVKLDDLNVELGEYDFDAKLLPIRIAVGPDSKWPISTRSPSISRDDLDVSVQRKVGKVGRKDVTLSGQETFVTYANSSSMQLNAKLDPSVAEEWKKEHRKVDVLIVERFVGLGYHKVCKNSCANILGSVVCSADNVGFGEFYKAELVGYRISIGNVIIAEKQPHTDAAK